MEDNQNKSKTNDFKDEIKPKKKNYKKRNKKKQYLKDAIFDEPKKGRKRIPFVGVVIFMILAIVAVTFIVAKISTDGTTDKIRSKMTEQISNINVENTDFLIEETDEVTVETTTEMSESDKILNDIRNSDLPASFENDEFEAVLQMPELPTGCEITSLTAVLNYWGYDIDKCEMADNYLIRRTEPTTDFYHAFIGSPYDSNSFGCFAPVIAKTAEKFFRAQDEDDRMYVEDLSGKNFKVLLQSVASGYPVMTWVTVANLHDPNWVQYWTLANGTEVYFPNYEHCVVITGYDMDNGLIYVADPLKGNYTYDINRFQEVYSLMGKQAVLLYRPLTKSEKAEVNMLRSTEKYTGIFTQPSTEKDTEPAKSDYYQSYDDDNSNNDDDGGDNSDDYYEENTTRERHYQEETTKKREMPTQPAAEKAKRKKVTEAPTNNFNSYINAETADSKENIEYGD